LPNREFCLSMQAVDEWLINICDDTGTKDALQFLMAREITHMKVFTTALERREPEEEPVRDREDPAINFAVGDRLLELTGDNRAHESHGDGDNQLTWRSTSRWCLLLS